MILVGPGSEANSARPPVVRHYEPSAALPAGFGG